MKYYIIAGEASGDMHAANLMREISIEDKDAVFRCHGGDLMQEAGGDIVRHYKHTAVMGFVNVLKNLAKIKSNLDFIKADIKDWQADAIIFVDFPGFNLKIAKYTKSIGIKNYYYISPKIWAWKKWRIKSIKKYIDSMLCIFPFEVDFYKEFDYPVFYGGNPLVDAIERNLDKTQTLESFLEKNALDDKPIIALLAGSRKQELNKILPEMLNVIKDYPDYQFVIAGAPSMSDEDYKDYISGFDVKIVYAQTYQLVHHAQAALVTSGTATLETAIINTPEVVCYRAGGGKIGFKLFWPLLNIKFISLVNIIMDRELVKELIQHNFNEKNIENELNAILFDKEYRKNMLIDFDLLREKLGSAGASNRFAKEIVSSIND
ncbi:MAG: lipid-A-disaccharide synthase [Marinifilaceae bacterium]